MDSWAYFSITLKAGQKKYNITSCNVQIKESFSLIYNVMSKLTFFWALTHMSVPVKCDKACKSLIKLGSSKEKQICSLYSGKSNEKS